MAPSGGWGEEGGVYSSNTAREGNTRKREKGPPKLNRRPSPELSGPVPLRFNS